MKPASIAAFAGLLCGMTFATPLPASVNVVVPRCEYAENPLGVDATQPRLSWMLESNERGQRQIAYRVLVASSQEKLRSGDCDLWDSGKVAEDRSIQVVYEGKPLGSRQRCFWKVCVWDQEGRIAESEPAYWEMGLLKPEDWKARWISFTTASTQTLPFQDAKWIWYPEGSPAGSAPKGERFFRRVVALPADAAIRSAKLTITVDDQFTLYVNGDEIGKSNGQIDAWKEKHTYDLTSRLRTGQNLLAVKAFNNASAAGLLARLEIVCEGSKLEFVSDESWKTSAVGLENWFRRDYDDSDWKESTVIAKFGEGPWGDVLNGEMALGQVPHLRKSVTLRKKIKQARLYASALGVYEFYVNGERVGRDVFNPSWTDYKTRVQYHTYDITNLLERGDNALGVILGDGWYAGYVGLGGPRRYGPVAAALAQVEVEFTDGSCEKIVTDASWKAENGPLLQSDMLMGETYDARRELTGWNTPSFNDSNWAVVQAPNVTVPRLVAAPDGPVRKMLEIQPRTLTEPKPGHYVFDLGQNMVGWARLRVKGQAGTTVTLKFVEMLNPDGTIYTTNLRGAKATDYYTLKGGGGEAWEPRFTFHGFRYVELTGFPGKPGLDAITAVVLYSDTPEVGSFECSNPLINQLQSNITWGQRGNFLAVPTDCPQRDERLGWMGDAQIFIRTATYNMDVARFFTKWCQDVQDAQRPDGAFTDVSPFVCCGAGTAAWGDAGVICPWTVYRVYGDTRILEQHYAAGAKWIDYLLGHSRELLRPAEGYGDWLSIAADTPKDVLATAYFALSTRMMANYAKALGRMNDYAKYEALFEDIKTAFNKAYVSEDVRIKGDTQTDYVLALAFDLLPPDKRAAAARHLVDDISAKGDHLSTGFVGVGHLTPTLTREGYLDVAYKLLLQESFPGWLYSVRNGATTIWERWDGWTKEKGFQDPGMNSFNHYSLGSVGEWLYSTVAGIDLDPDVPAYKRIIIHPRPGGNLTFAKARFQSIHGKIISDWSIKDNEFRLNLVIPANTTAEVVLPTEMADKVRESGKPTDQAQAVRFVEVRDNSAVFEVGSGKYEFTCPFGIRPK